MNRKGLFIGLSASIFSEILIFACYDNLAEFGCGFGVGVIVFLISYFVGSC